MRAIVNCWVQDVGDAEANFVLEVLIEEDPNFEQKQTNDAHLVQ